MSCRRGKKEEGHGHFCPSAFLEMFTTSRLKAKKKKKDSSSSLVLQEAMIQHERISSGTAPRNICIVYIALVPKRS